MKMLIIIFCFCINIYANDNIKENNENKLVLQTVGISSPVDIFIYDIDINKDGILDKVVSQGYTIGDRLYFLIKTKNKYKIVYEGTNFSQDGAFAVKSIEALSDKDHVLRITTFFTSNGMSEYEYNISYRNNDWYLDNVLYKLDYSLDFDRRVDLCLVQENTPLKDAPMHSYPREKNRDEKCTLIFENLTDNLKGFIKRINSQPKSTYDSTQRYKALFAKYPLTKKNVVDYNNIAYYLQKREGSYRESIYILERILKKYPNRIVAYCNLGDAYMQMGYKSKGRNAYKKYIQLMRKAGKENKIAQRLKGRF